MKNNSSVRRLFKEEVSGKRQLVILGKVLESLEKLNAKLDIIIDVQKAGQKALSVPDATLDVMTLLNMPDHLRKTAVIICRRGRATAEEIAEQTNRARAVESAYLNQLVTMGYIKKMRKGRKAYFYVDRE